MDDDRSELGGRERLHTTVPCAPTDGSTAAGTGNPRARATVHSPRPVEGSKPATRVSPTLMATPPPMTAPVGASPPPVPTSAFHAARSGGAAPNDGASP